MIYWTDRPPQRDQSFETVYRVLSNLRHQRKCRDRGRRPISDVRSLIIIRLKSQMLVSEKWPHRCLLPLSVAMLKVSVKDRPGSLTFVLEGRLCGPSTAEAERGWNELMSRVGEKEIVLDVLGLTFVDFAGEQLLGSILERHPTVRVRGVLMSHLVQQVRRGLSSKPPQASRGTPERSRRSGES
jgi:anti-anti-sigma regulatory factor